MKRPLSIPIAAWFCLAVTTVFFVSCTVSPTLTPSPPSRSSAPSPSPSRSSGFDPEAPRVPTITSFHVGQQVVFLRDSTTHTITRIVGSIVECACPTNDTFCCGFPEDFLPID